MKAALAGGPLSKLQPSAILRATAKVNWKVFHDAVMEPLLDHFSALSVDHARSPAEEKLCYLSQAFMEVAMAVEYFGEPDVPDGFDRARWQIVKG